MQTGRANAVVVRQEEAHRRCVPTAGAGAHGERSGPRPSGVAPAGSGYIWERVERNSDALHVQVGCAHAGRRRREVAVRQVPRERVAQRDRRGRGDRPEHAGAVDRLAARHPDRHRPAGQVLRARLPGQVAGPGSQPGPGSRRPSGGRDAGRPGRGRSALSHRIRRVRRCSTANRTTARRASAGRRSVVSRTFCRPRRAVRRHLRVAVPALAGPLLSACRWPSATGSSTTRSVFRRWRSTTPSTACRRARRSRRGRSGSPRTRCSRSRPAGTSRTSSG